MKQNLGQRYREDEKVLYSVPVCYITNLGHHGETVSNSEHVSCSVVHVAEDLFIRKCLLSKYFYPYTTE